MNGPEFFMQHAGYRLLPAALHTGDPFFDSITLFSASLPLSTGASLRLSTCWMVVTPTWVATSFKAHPDCGFAQDVPLPEAKLRALKSSQPCMILQLGKRTPSPRDLFVTYDPRAVYICGQGSTKVIDYTKEKSWTS